VLSGTLE
jgi:hypothetical protein